MISPATFEDFGMPSLRAPEPCPELTRIPGTGDLLMIWDNSAYDPNGRSDY